jgi:hypothetical protein
MMRFLANAWVQDPCFVKIISLISEAFLQGRGTGLMKANVQN